MRITILLFILFVGCKNKCFETEGQFYKWLNDEENGLIKSYVDESGSITVKYLPPEYLAYNELKSISFTKGQFDSVFADHQNNMCFLISLESSGKYGKSEMLLNNADDMGDFKRKVHELSFQSDEFISLFNGEEELLGSYSALENIYNIDNKKNIIVVFPLNPKSMDNQEVYLQIDDPVFDSGLHKFLFKREDFNNLPEFNFIKNTI